jgi:signal transduction histidine kinase
VGQIYKEKLDGRAFKERNSLVGSAFFSSKSENKNITRAQLKKKLTELRQRVIEIKELKKEEPRIIQSERDLNSTINTITDMITIHDNDYNIIYANSSAAKMLKLPSAGTKKLKCYEYYHGSKHPPKDCPSCQALKSKILATEEIFEPHLNKNIEIKAFPRTNGKKQTIGSIHIVRDITEKKQKEEQLRDSREKLRNLAVHLQHVIESERKRIAREIHDELGQELAVLNLEMLKLGKEIPLKQKLVHDKIKSISKRILSNISTVQKIVTDLRPALIDKIDFQAAIEWQAEEFQKRTGIKCDFTFDAELIKLDKEQEVAVFRILQEMLTNVVRHADATRVKVMLKEKAGKLIVSVKDNGKGITEAQITDPKSFGIIGINERVSFMEGSVAIKGIQNKGTSVTIRIPVHKKNSLIKNRLKKESVCDGKNTHC